MTNAWIWIYLPPLKTLYIHGFNRGNGWTTSVHWQVILTFSSRRGTLSAIPLYPTYELGPFFNRYSRRNFDAILTDDTISNSASINYFPFHLSISGKYQKNEIVYPHFPPTQIHSGGFHIISYFKFHNSPIHISFSTVEDGQKKKEI